MSVIQFIESGITFEFDAGNCFRIEDDPIVAQGNVRGSTQNNKACECVTVIEDHHYFIEVKKSAPKGPTGRVEDLSLNGEKIPANWEAYNNYQKFLREISKKFIDSFSLLKSIMENRHGEDKKKSIPLSLKILDLDKMRFILIINLNNDKIGNIDKQAMSTLKDAITNELRPFLKIWNIPDRSVKVVLPSQAKDYLGIPIIKY